MLREKGNFSWSFQACPIWWRGESVKCEYVWSEIQQLPLSVGGPSDGDLTSSWCKAVSCGREVVGSDLKVLTAEKWDMTIFLMCSLKTMWQAFGRADVERAAEMIMGTSHRKSTVGQGSKIHSTESHASVFNFNEWLNKSKQLLWPV